MIINDWPTKIEDLAVAHAIVGKYEELNEGEPLGFIEIVVDKSQGKPVEIRVPAWIRELIGYFRAEYGYEYGQAITAKVLTRLVLKDETIH